VLISLILAWTDVIKWLDFLTYCSYVKLTITLIKYVPQVRLWRLLKKTIIQWNSVVNFKIFLLKWGLAEMNVVKNVYSRIPINVPAFYVHWQWSRANNLLSLRFSFCNSRVKFLLFQIPVLPKEDVIEVSLYKRSKSICWYLWIVLIYALHLSFLMIIDVQRHKPVSLIINVQWHSPSLSCNMYKFFPFTVRGLCLILSKMPLLWLYRIYHMNLNGDLSPVRINENFMTMITCLSFQVI